MTSRDFLTSYSISQVKVPVLVAHTSPNTAHMKCTAAVLRFTTAPYCSTSVIRHTYVRILNDAHEKHKTLKIVFNYCCRHPFESATVSSPSIVYRIIQLPIIYHYPRRLPSSIIFFQLSIVYRLLPAVHPRWYGA